jgi:spore germination cell wall hydrolase CwlJ-like protein
MTRAGECRLSHVMRLLLMVVLAAADCAAVQAQSAAPEDPARARECLTLAVAYEAGFEPAAGQQAVAQVVLNRLRAPGYPKSVCAVVFAGAARRTGCQFTFTCDGALRRRLPDAVLARARAVAEHALAGDLPDPVAGATHYHADYVSPYWAPTLVRLAKIGAHIFYRAGARGPAPATQVIAAAAAPPVAPPPPRSPFMPWGLSPAR